MNKTGVTVSFIKEAETQHISRTIQDTRELNNGFNFGFRRPGKKKSKQRKMRRIKKVHLI